MTESKTKQTWSHGYLWFSFPWDVFIPHVLQLGFSRNASEFLLEEVIPELNGEDDLGVREDQIL